MKKNICFAVPPAVEQALEVAVNALRARQPGQKVTRSDALRIAIVSLAASVQRVAKAPTPVAQLEDAEHA